MLTACRKCSQCAVMKYLQSISVADIWEGLAMNTDTMMKALVIMLAR